MYAEAVYLLDTFALLLDPELARVNYEVSVVGNDASQKECCPLNNFKHRKLSQLQYSVLPSKLRCDKG